MLIAEAPLTYLLPNESPKNEIIKLENGKEYLFPISTRSSLVSPPILFISLTDFFNSFIVRVLGSTLLVINLSGSSSYLSSVKSFTSSAFFSSFPL